LVPPTKQRLGTDDAARPVNLWLVTKEELLLLQRFPEVSLKGRPGGDHGLHLGSKKRKVLRPVALASYMARSARFINSSIASCWPPNSVMPILGVL
jgi:hypothetical protein